MSVECKLCKKGAALYKCPKCGVTAHINKKKKEIVIHIPPIKLPKTITPFSAPISFCFPSHFDCELFKPIDQIDLKKLAKVEVKPK